MSQADRLLLRSSPSEDTGPEMGLLLGRALAMDCRRVAVARDLMRSSSMMKEALVSGLLSAGVDVVDLGVTSGPALAMAASLGDCAVYVTEYRGYGMISGYLLVNPDGSLFRREQMRHLERVFVDPPELPGSGNLGHVTRYGDAEEAYRMRLCQMVPGGCECTVALDCGCGPASASAPQILNSMGAGVMAINAQMDMDYKSEGMNDMGLDIHGVRNMVESNPGSIGISLNKVGTMMALLDENGREMGPEAIVSIVVMNLRPASIAVPIDTSSLVLDAFHGRFREDGEDADDRELEVVMTERSAGAVCSAVAAGAEIGYYEGGIIFGRTSMMPDGIQAAAVVSAVAGRVSLSRLADGLPRYNRDSSERECTCSPEAFVRGINESIQEVEGTVVSRGDSWRVDMKEGWFLVSLVRGTSPTVGIVAESEDRAYLVGLMEIADNIVSECMKGQ